MSSRTEQGAGAKPAREALQDFHELENMIGEAPSPERVCAKIAQILRVQRNEVALLRIDKGSLRFIVPAELRAAGIIPMSESAVAARTASTGSPLLSNSFARVRHASLFEAVKLGATGEQASEHPPIQKIMSVPVRRGDSTIRGVIQISRKGVDPSLAGTDFSSDDLKDLEQIAVALARMPFMEESAQLGNP